MRKAWRHSSNAPVVYFPKGLYKLSSSITMSYENGGANGGVSLEGDGSGTTILSFTANMGAAIVYESLGTYAGGHIHVSDIAIGGIGHAGGQTGIEIDNTNNIDVRNVTVVNMGDTAIKARGGRRTNNFDNLELDNTRRCIANTGNANENYYTHVHCIQPGLDSGNYSYNVNAAMNTSNPGTIPSSGPIYPDYHAAITVFGGQNVHFDYGSVKNMINMRGFQFQGTSAGSLTHFYVEGFGPPSENPDLQIGGGGRPQ